MKSLPLILTSFAALVAALPASAQLEVTVTSDGATFLLSPGSSVGLTAIDIGQPVLATVTVQNTGSAAASVSGVSVAGTSEMSLALAPVFPVVLNANASTTFGVQYLPTSGNAVTAQVSIAFVTGGQAGTFPLFVMGRSPRLAYSYSIQPNGAVNDLNSGDRITFPGTNVGSTTAAVLNVLNRGSAPATLKSALVTGGAFQLVDASSSIEVGAGAQASFSINFTPQATGGSQGLLVLGLANTNIAFFLAGTGTTTDFTATYTLSDGNVRPLTDGTAIVLPNVDVNTTTTATFEILNRGTGSGMVSGISLLGAGFRLTGVPLLPATLGPGQSLRFGIVFAPSQAGSFTGSVSITLPGRTLSASVTGSTTSASFSLSYTPANGTATGLASGGTIGFQPVDISSTTTTAVEITNQGPGPGVISAIAVFGNGFRLTGTPVLPFTVAAGQSLRFGIIFAPTQAGSYIGSFRLDLPGGALFGNLSAATATANTAFAYIEPNTNNVLPLHDGAGLTFPPTPTGNSTTLTLLVTNNGSGTGVVDSIIFNSSASAFQLLNLPSFPLSLPPTQQLRFGLRFTPPQQQVFLGRLLVSVDGRTTAFDVEAQGSGPLLTYGYGPGSVLLPGGTINLGDSAVGQNVSVPVIVGNSGTAEARIAAVSVTGSAFQLSDVPSTPFNVAVGGSQSFTLNFTPSQPGAASGRLTIGSDTFTIIGNGIGSRLTFSYVSAAEPITVAENGVVIFTPIQVGKSGRLQFRIQNTGTSAASVATINLANSSTVFSLDQLPPLPFSLGAGASISFGVVFTPSTTGSQTATLRVNESGFTLTGSGDAPAQLPPYDFNTAPGIEQPAQQPSIGLTLAAPYPVAIDGTLKLTFASNVFADDPAIQFATGGRTVSFTIPANSTRALFNGNSTLALQTGTTAGTIVVTPSFTIRGGFDLTPGTPIPLSITIDRAAPKLSNVSITSVTATSFNLVISGYSTTRALRQFSVQFTPKTGQSINGTQVTLDVTSAASAWYQSAASQGTGGSFLVAIPFVLQNGGSTDDLVHRLQSVSVTSINDVGSSGAVSAVIP